MVTHKSNKKKSVFQDYKNSSEAVLPGDLLTLTVRSAVVRYPNLVYPALFFPHFNGDFRFNSKTILFDLNASDNLRSEHLITGFHVSEVQIAEHVGK